MSRAKRYLLWLPPVIVGLWAACTPMLRTGSRGIDVRAWLLGGAATYVVVFLFVRFAIHVTQMLRDEALEDRTIARRAAGLCVTCGYSLRDNVSGTCPECGSRAD